MDFYYDSQTRRYLLQFMRCFSNIKIRLGPDANGLYQIQRVPVLYGDPSSMVAQLIKGASENTLLPAPMMSVSVEGIKMATKRRQAPQYVGKLSTIEREFNYQTQTYGTGPGVRQDIERYMPSPYDYTFRLDVWTTNTETKLQILEQIQMIFNPSIQLQQDSNLLDWTSIFEVWMDENIVWSNKSIPQGTDDIRDIMTLKFKVEAWINPPAKLKRSGLIAEIVTQVFAVDDVSTINTKNEYDPFSCLSNIPIQIVTTEGNYKISVAKGTTTDTITLLNEYGQIDPTLSWQSLIQKYGQITPSITNIVLKLDPNIEVDTSDIIGTIEISPTEQNVLLFNIDIDTLPVNTLTSITTIIDPTEVTPGNGLPKAIPGQRYLLTSNDSTGEEPAVPPNVALSPWGQLLVAYPNDIIEFNGINWIVSFDSKTAIGKNYVVNNANSSQYMFNAATQEWSYTYYGKYNAGYWRIDNLISAPCGTTASNYE